jgi:hypothetical protein
MKNKKALSGVITVLMMVMLALVITAVIWSLLKNTVEETTSQAGGQLACLETNLEITSADPCPAGSTSCEVVVRRKTGGDEIQGIKVIITDGKSTLAGEGDSIGILEMTSVIATGESLEGDATTAEVSAMIGDSSGDVTICDPSYTYNY